MQAQELAWVVGLWNLHMCMSTRQRVFETATSAIEGHAIAMAKLERQHVDAQVNKQIRGLCGSLAKE